MKNSIGRNLALTVNGVELAEQRLVYRKLVAGSADIAVRHSSSLPDFSRGGGR